MFLVFFFNLCTDVYLCVQLCFWFVHNKMLSNSLNRINFVLAGHHHNLINSVHNIIFSHFSCSHTDIFYRRELITNFHKPGSGVPTLPVEIQARYPGDCLGTIRNAPAATGSPASSLMKLGSVVGIET